MGTYKIPPPKLPPPNKEGFIKGRLTIGFP